MESLGKAEFLINSSEEVRDLQFAVNRAMDQLFVSTIQKQGMSGKMSYMYYYADTAFGENPEFNKINFADPAGSSELREVSDLQLKSTDGVTTLLFKAIGNTQTTLKETKVTKLSNTPSISNHPTWVEPDTLV